MYNTQTGCMASQITVYIFDVFDAVQQLKMRTVTRLWIYSEAYFKCFFEKNSRLLDFERLRLKLHFLFLAEFAQQRGK